MSRFLFFPTQQTFCSTFQVGLSPKLHNGEPSTEYIDIQIFPRPTYYARLVVLQTEVLKRESYGCDSNVG